MFEKIKSLFKNSVDEDLEVKNTIDNLPIPKMPEAVEVDENHISFSLNMSDQTNSMNINALIESYREMALDQDVSDAIEEIVNEAIIDDGDEILVLNLDGIDINKKLKETINTEFEKLLNLLKFNINGDELFKQWYIDGRLIVQLLVDMKSPAKGIQGFKILDPTLLKRMKHKKTQEVFYVFKDEMNEYIIPEDHIIFIDSGIVDRKLNRYLSYIHRAIRPLNQVRLLEDSLIIYRITRAPERRVFYIDTGKLGKTKAEQYIKSLMQKYKNKVVYDPVTGKPDQRKNVMTMVEDFWMPVSSDGRGTKVDTLAGGQQIGEITDVELFKKSLRKSLRVPPSRFDKDQQTTIMFDRVGEITREELRFSKFINRLRKKFSNLFTIALKRHCLLKKIVTVEEWNNYFEDNIKYNWAVDNFYEEVKELERIKTRLDVLSQIDSYVGKYYSRTWVKKRVLWQSDADIEDMEAEMEEDGSKADIEEEI